MTLQPNDWTIIPEQTAQIARAAFPKGNIYKRKQKEKREKNRDRNKDTKKRADCGQPPISPAQLALITIMQFALMLKRSTNGRCRQSTLGLEVCFRARVNRPRL